MSKCAICLFKIKPYCKKSLSCSHYFCQECIEQWFNTKGNKSCPICREKHQDIHKTIKTRLSDVNESDSQNEITPHYNLRPRSVRRLDTPIENTFDYDRDIIDNWYNNLDNGRVSERTRNKTQDVRIICLVGEIKSLLKMVDLATVCQEKINVSGRIFSVLKENKWFIDENPNFKIVVINKLKEFYQLSENDNYPDLKYKAQTWYFGIFGESLN